MAVEIKRSHLPTKKFNAAIDGKRTVPFGQKRAEDYTMHKDDIRKQRYIERHRSRENWNDPTTPGFYSRWLTWNKPTLRESVADVNKRFKSVKITLR